MKKPLFRRNFFLSLLLIIVAGLIMAVALIHQFARPARGTITTLPTTPVSNTPAVTYLTKVGTKVSFRYPSFFSMIASQPSTPPTIERYNFLKRQVGSWQLAIEVDTLPSGQLQDFNGYQYRTLHPGTYQASTLVINGQQIPIMTDLTTPIFSKVAFLVHGSVVATVALSGGSGKDISSMQTTLVNLLQSWQWH